MGVTVPGVNVSVRGAQEVKRLFDNMVKQARFATAVALTRTAKDAQRNLARRVEKDFDRPVPFTKKAFGIIPASKLKPVAVVFVKDLQAKYLRFQIVGGRRSPKRKVEAVPVNIKLNQYGNIPGRHRGKLSQLLAKPDTFTDTIYGIPGIWQRRNNRLRLLVRFEPHVTYNKKFDFHREVFRTYDREFKTHFKREFLKAIR